MSIDIRIDSYDIVDMDERLDRAFDIRNGWGTEAVGDDNIMLTENMGRFPQGSIHAVMQTQQAQIEDQQQTIDSLITSITELKSSVISITRALDSNYKIG